MNPEQQADIHGLQPADFMTIIAYLAAVVALGAWFSRKTEDTDAYLMGGRTMPWWLIGVSYIASLISTVSMVGAPGEAYKSGITGSLWPIFGVVFSIGFFFLFVRFYFQTRTFTPFEYLERRFGIASRGWAAGIYCVARGLYLATVLFAAAKVFQGTSDWPVPWTILLVGSVGVLYTTMGGFRAVVWTDFLQFIVLAGGVGLVAFQAVRVTPGGLLDAFRYAAEQDHLLPELADGTFFSLSPYVRLTLWVILLRAVADHLFYKSADQILVQRMLATKGYWEAFRSVVFGSIIAPAIVLLLYVVGLCLFRYYAQFPPEERPPADLAMFRFITSQFPAPVPGLFVAAMLAAIMSTLDSGINSLATVVTKDFYLRFWRPDSTETEQVRFSRWMTIAAGLLVIGAALGIAWSAETVGGTVMESSGVWQSLVVVLAPVFLLGVATRRAGQLQAMVAMLVGLVVTAALIAWYYLARSRGVEAGFHVAAVGGFLVTLAVGFGLCLFARPRPKGEPENLTLWTLRPPKNG
ncbi:MAG: sodium/solute symporter [Patescibacteria group bacterium]|nr:sodium/solute symporter [Patescibacteria group bacterium]